MTLSVTKQEMKYLGGTKIMSFTKIRNLIRKQREKIVHRTAKGGSIKLSSSLTVAELCSVLQMFSEEGLALTKPFFCLGKKNLELSSLSVKDGHIVFNLKENK